MQVLGSMYMVFDRWQFAQGSIARSCDLCGTGNKVDEDDERIEAIERYRRASFILCSMHVVC
jgi:hypothetical protein